MRQLSYDSDALSAFLGILHSLEESREPIRHLWGLLLWKIPFYAVRVTLNWYHQSPSKRRPNFPSWSWIVWDGPVQLPRFDTDVLRGFIHIEISKTRHPVDIHDFLALDPISYQQPELGMASISPSTDWLSNCSHSKILAGTSNRYQRVHLCICSIARNRSGFHDDVDSTPSCHLLISLTNFPSSTWTRRSLSKTQLQMACLDSLYPGRVIPNWG